MRDYVLRLICAALVCALVPNLVSGSSAGRIAKLVCGIFLAVSALEPLAGSQLPDMEDILPDYAYEAREAAAWGEKMAGEEREERITQALEAYILDKAAAMGVTLDAELRLDSRGFPDSIRLTGEVSEKDRLILEQLLTAQLSIPKEKQQWTGQKQSNGSPNG